MKLTTFQNIAGRYARAHGRDSGIRVTFGGRQAFVTPGRLNLPALPPGTIMSTYHADVFRGYLDHEVGHLRNTDLRLVQQQPEFAPLEEGTSGTMPKPNPKYDPILTWLWNVSEDVYEERVECGDWPGKRRFLDTTHRFMDGECRKELEAKREAGEEDDWSHMVLRAFYREVWSYRDVARDVGHDLTLEDLGCPAVQAAIEEDLPGLASTSDCLLFARRVKALLEEASEEFGKGDDEDGEEGGDGEGQPGDGTGQPGEPGKGGQPSEKGDLDEAAQDLFNMLMDKAFEQLMAEVGKLNAKKGGTPNAGVGSPGDDEDDEGVPFGSSLPSTVPKVELDPDHAGHPHREMPHGDVWLPPSSTEQDRVFVPSEEDENTYRTERANLSAEISATKKALNQYLRAATMTAWSRGLLEGDLDEEMLADHAAFGDRRIRKLKRQRTMRSCAISLMVDLSASMNASIVRQTAITIAEALATISKVKLQVAGFYIGGGSYPEEAGCGRRCPLKIPLFKGFDEPYLKTTARLGAIGTSGTTPLAEGYAYAFDSVLTRKEQRRIVWVVTDGAPYYAVCHGRYGDHSDWALTADIYRKAQKLGVETMALGIGHATGMAPHVDRFARIGEITDLNAAILRLTREIFLNEDAFEG